MLMPLVIVCVLFNLLPSANVFKNHSPFFLKKIFFSSPFHPCRSFEQYDAYSGSSDIGHGDGGRL